MTPELIEKCREAIQALAADHTDNISVESLLVAIIPIIERDLQGTGE